MSTRDPQERKLVFYVKAMFVTTVVIALASVAVVAYQGLGIARAKARTKEDLTRIHAALMTYHDEYACFPPTYVLDDGGKPMHSWRALLLPYLTDDSEYRFDEPWDSPANRRAAVQAGGFFGSDNESEPITPYVGVVSHYSAWAGSRCTSIRDIMDGTSNTILLLAITNSDIGCLEPREWTLDDALGPDRSWSKLVEEQTAPIHPYALFGDGSVRDTRDVNKLVFGTMLSIGKTRLIEPIPWSSKPESDQRLGLEEGGSGPLLSADELTRTDVLPHLDGAIVPGSSYAYCASFRMAWHEKRKRFPIQTASNEHEGAPSRADGPIPNMAAVLDANPFDPATVDAKSCLVTVGRIEGGVLDENLALLERRVPGHSVTFDELPDRGLLIFAYLWKSLPFEIPFDRLVDPLVFESVDGKTDVDAFGVLDFHENSDDDRKLAEQVTIHDYVDEDDFVLELRTLPDESIVLAKVKPEATLRATVDSVKDRIAEARSRGRNQRWTFETFETLIVPCLSLNVDRHYRELVGLPVPGAGPVLDAWQVIRFRLDERGAELESWGGEVLDSNEPGGPPRRFVFDKPFLVYLAEKNAAEPYLAIWVGSTDLLRRRTTKASATNGAVDRGAGSRGR